MFDRERKKVYKAGIDNVAAQRDFNAIDVEGMDADAFEKSMSGFETELADALQRIAARPLARQRRGPRISAQPRRPDRDA